MNIFYIKQHALNNILYKLYDAIKKKIFFFFWDRVPKRIVARWIYNSPINIDNTSNILFIEASNAFDGWWLGDGIFRIPVIEALSCTTGNPIDVLTTEKRALIFQNNPYIRNVLIAQESVLRSIGYIRKNKYSHIFMFNPSWRMFFIMILTGDFSTKRKIGLIWAKKRALENHIDMYADCLKKIVQNLIVRHNIPYIHWKTKRTLLEWFFYIGINIGANSSLRNYKDWIPVLNQIKIPVPKNVRFVLVGNSQIQNINVLIVNKLWSSVIDCTMNLSLNDTYNVISQCHAFIWADGGNVNAALAILQKNVFPIYSIVPWQTRLPSNFPENNIIQWICPIYGNSGCYESAHLTNINGMRCEITWQSESNDLVVPPCISGSSISKLIAIKIEMLYLQAEKLLLKKQDSD